MGRMGHGVGMCKTLFVCVCDISLLVNAPSPDQVVCLNNVFGILLLLRIGFNLGVSSPLKPSLRSHLFSWYI